MRRLTALVITASLVIPVFAFNTLAQIKSIQTRRAYHAVAQSGPSKVLREMAKHYKFVLFYDSRCPHCRRFAPVVRAVADTYGFTVIPITLNGGILPSFPHSIDNTWQASAYGVNAYPTLFLLSNRRRQAFAVNVGEMPEQALINRLMELNQHIKEYDNAQRYRNNRTDAGSTAR